jgi:predicted nucleic acid-binding protein/catechol 2,3-dioxygenase-like lactoylglutathione lyase family enzyme
MILVVDASAAVKLVLDEDGSDLVRRIWDEPLSLTAPSIVLPEVAAAIDAARRAGRISATMCRRAQRYWDEAAAEIDVVSVDVSLASRAGALAASRPARGMDAVYVALADRLAEETAVGLLSFDDRQRAVAAGSRALSLLPAELRPADSRVSADPAVVHHLELWLPDVPAVEASLGWLLGELGWAEHRRWQHAVRWRLGSTYLVVEQSPDLLPGRYERTAPGLNHLALHAGSPAAVDSIALAAPEHGWNLLFPDAHPYAGGSEHYAAYLEDGNGLEIELVAAQAPPTGRRGARKRAVATVGEG